MTLFRATLIRLVTLASILLAGSSVGAAPSRQTVAEITIGYSAQGRPITALRVGDGPRKLVLVGATHGFPEANTYQLALQLAEYFRANPQAVPPLVRLYIIPALNPDGIALGTRFNARGVDLNRNMNTNLDACPENDWRVTVEGAYGIISDTGGPYADSEVESRLVQGFLLDASAVIFYHSNAGSVFPAFCEHAPSIALAQAYAEGAGYRYTRYWEPYTITGGMHDWASSLGIAAITPELLTGDLPEFEQNLAGVLAVLARAEELIPELSEVAEGGFAVPAPIWRYWRAHGGAELFGAPLGPAVTSGALTRQHFERALLEMRQELAETPYYVQPAPLGRQRHEEAAFKGGPAASCDALPAPCRYFPETGHTLHGVFATFWERGGGLDVFGFPLTEEFEAITADGQRRTAQRFERAVFAYYPEDGSVRLEPLGWADLIRTGVRAPTLAHQAR
ncbi:MAG: M14 family metallopeptidase [Chloroflexota bacterium]